MIVGYARVSTDGQTLDAQQAALRVDGLQIHGARSEAAFAILEDVSSKPHGGDRCY